MRTAIYPSDKALFLERYHLYLRNNLRVTDKIFMIAGAQYDPLFFAAQEVRIIHYWFSLHMTFKEIVDKMDVSPTTVRRFMQQIVYKLDSNRHSIYWRENILANLENKLNQTLAALPITPSAMAALVAANMTMDQLKQMNDNELTDIKGIGPKTVEAIRKHLEKEGAGVE